MDTSGIIYLMSNYLMNNEEGRNFKRYKTLSECEVSLKTGIYKGKVLDYSEGVSAIFENVPQLIPGTQANIKILDLEMDLKCEVVWVKKIDDNLSRVGFKRVDSFKGSLKNFKLADILLGLQKSTRTGILKIESGSIVKKIFIKSGDMIFATSNDENDRLGELLLKEGKITFEEYNRSANLCKKTKKKLGNIFVELGYLTPNELFREIRHQIEEIIFSLFAFEKGNFEFQEGPLPSEEFITLRISAANLIYQGIKRINNFLYIKQICPPIDAVLNLSSNPLNIFQDLALEYPDKKILSYINGMYSIRTILSLSPSKDFETLKTICAFLSIGLVKVKEENETPVEFSIKEILGEPDEEITAEFIETIEDMYNKCETLEYYEILGIEKEASPEEITKAYYRLSKQFHPDRHFSLPSYEIKGKLIKILFYITRAYKILSVPEKRKEYDRTLSLQASDLETQVADEVTAKVHGQMSDMKIVELKNKDELQAEVLRTAYDDTFVLEKDNVYMKEKKYKDISKNRNDVFKIEEEISETQLEEQKQPISELTTDTDTATGKEHDVLEEEIFKEKEIAKGDNGLKTVPEQTLDEEVEELKSSDEEPQLDVVKVAQDDVTSLETDRIKKKRLYTTIVTAVAVVSIMVLSVIYKNFNKTYQQPVPVVTKAVKEQRLPQLPPLRDELIRKLLSEVPEQQPQLPPLRDELISWGSR